MTTQTNNTAANPKTASSTPSNWDLLREPFTLDLPRMAALFVKESRDTNAYVMPTGKQDLGWAFDFSIKSGYNQQPQFSIAFAAHERPIDGGRGFDPQVFFSRQEIRPGLVERRFAFAANGLSGVEQLGSGVPGSLTWRFDLESRTEWYRQTSHIITILRSDELFRVIPSDDGLTLRFPERDYFITCSEPLISGLFADERQMARGLAVSPYVQTVSEGFYLALGIDLDLASLERRTITFGLSSVSLAKARAARACPDLEEAVRADWNAFFAGLPRFDWPSERDRHFWYKCWATIRGNYYEHPDWGHMVLESLPVYKGIWQWAMPAVEWHSVQNPDFPALWIRKAMDLMLQYQRDDGYITHAIYIDEDVPGERWARGGVIQTPHYPWVALRYWQATGDRAALSRWTPHLVRYYEYLNASRDARYNNWHLWAIESSYDTGLDTTAAFQRVTYGEHDHPRERFCYPAILAAERWRYELALAELLDLTGGDGAPYRAAAAKTRAAMHERLWDETRSWFGVRHEDGSLDTRVGVDGLFALAYGAVDPDLVPRMKTNFSSLIGPYGVRTVARGEPGFRADTYWRGAGWPKPLSLAAAIAARWYPDLAESVNNALLAFSLGMPSIWECLNVDTGEAARSDQGFFCTPCMTSNVGAGELLGAWLIGRGFDMLATDMVLPLQPVVGFHHAGGRITIARIDTTTDATTGSAAGSGITRQIGDWRITFTPLEQTSATLRLRDAAGTIHEVVFSE